MTGPNIVYAPWAKYIADFFIFFCLQLIPFSYTDYTFGADLRTHSFIHPYKHVINALLCVRHYPEGARNTHPQNLQRQVGKLNKQ